VPTPTRRNLLLGGATLLAAACSKASPPSSNGAPASPPPGGAWKLASFDRGPGAPDGERAMLLAPWSSPTDPPSNARPLLVALHGRGEAGRGLDVGAGGWPNDYLLDRMHHRLLAPPLTAADLRDMTSPERLAKLNASLAAAPYRGLAVATPYTPDLPDKSVEGAQDFARFVIDTLLPKLRAEAGSTVDRTGTGIDGVSMGGRLSLLVGLSHPEVFGAVGALQPAIRVEEAAMISALAKGAMAKAKLRLRLVTSEEDYFLPAVKAASERMRADGVEHEMLIIPGTHGYEFNRGPGGAEMMLWHERVLRGLPPP
jgi:poly(3-hydroxybutyrate) depolymerase